MSITNFECLGCIVVTKVNGSISSFFVVVVHPFVFVECKGAVFTGKEIEGDLFGLFLIGILNFRTKRDNGSLSYEERYATIGSIHSQLLPSLNECPSIEIIPAGGSGKIDLPIGCLVGVDGTDHQGITEHILVTDIVHLSIFAEIHYQRTHDGVIIEIGHPGHRIDIGHQPVTEFGVIEHRLVCGMPLGSDVKDFSVGKLSVRTEQGDKSSKLRPATVELAPFFQILIFNSGCLIVTLRLLIPLFHTKTSYIHCPVRYTR